MEAAFGITCNLGDGFGVLDISMFINMRKRRVSKFSTYLFIDDVADEIEPAGG